MFGGRRVYVGHQITAHWPDPKSKLGFRMEQFPIVSEGAN